MLQYFFTSAGQQQICIYFFVFTAEMTCSHNYHQVENVSTLIHSRLTSPFTFIIVWELKISIVAVLKVEFLPILAVYKTLAVQQSVVAVG